MLSKLQSFENIPIFLFFQLLSEVRPIKKNVREKHQLNQKC